MTNNLVNSHSAVGAIVYKRDLQRQVDRLQRGGVSRSLAKRGGGGGIVLHALPAFLPPVISSFFIQNKVGRGGGGGGASLDLQLQCLGRLWTRRNRSIT